MKSIDANVKSIKADGESVSELYNVHLNFYEFFESYCEDFGLTFDNSRRREGTTALSSTSAAGRLAGRTAKLRGTVWSGGFSLPKSASAPLAADP